MAGITITLEVDDKGSVKVKQFSDETKKAFDEMKKGPDQARGPLDALSQSWVGLTAKVAAASAVVYAAERALSSFAAEAMEAEDVQNRLRFAVEGSGGSWQALQSRVDAFGESVLKMTRFTDEDAKRALTDMYLYTSNYDKAQQGATLAMDMAVRKGMDLSSATRFIGMAMTGNIEILGRMLPEFRNINDLLGQNASMDEKAAYAMKVLQEKFGGTAQADIATYSGKVKQFQNQWKEFKEELGNSLLPVLGAVAEKLAEIMKMRESWNKGPVGQVEELLGPDVMRYLEVQAYGYDKEKVRAEFGGVPIPKPAKPEPPLDPWVRLYGLTEAELKDRLDISNLMYEAWLEHWNEDAQKMQTDVQSWWTRVEGNLKETEYAYAKEGPWTEMDLSEAEYNYYKKTAEVAAQARSEWVATYAETPNHIRDVLKMESTWQELGNSINQVWSENVTGILKGTTSIGDAFKNMATGMADAFISAVAKMIFNWILFQNVQGTYKSGAGLIGGIGALFGAKEGGILPGSWIPLRAFQSGGLVDQPTLGMIGEGGGPEAVVPLKGGKIPIEGGSGRPIFVEYNSFQVFADDPKNFEERHAGSIIKVIQTNARKGGQMKDIVRGVV